MPTLKDNLLGAIAHWQKKGEEAELASTEVDKTFPQGYLRGMAVAYNNAAKRLKAILATNAPKVVRHVKRVARKTTHFNKPLK